MVRPSRCVEGGVLGKLHSRSGQSLTGIRGASHNQQHQQAALHQAAAMHVGAPLALNHNNRPASMAHPPLAGRAVQPRGGFDGPLETPVRKAVSVFKHPVTLVHTTSRHTKAAPVDDPTLNKATHKGNQNKPKQVFWARRLSGLRAMVPLDCKTDGGGDCLQDAVALPSSMRPVGPGIGEESAAASLAAALQPPVAAVAPLLGQTNQKKYLDANPAVFVNPDQPLVQAMAVQDKDVQSQQERVLDARQRLEEARKHFGR